MVEILPPNPGFGAQLARGLGAGMSAGIGQGIDYSQKMSLQRQKEEQKNKFFSQLMGKKGSSQGETQEEQALTPEQETALALQHPVAFNAYKHLKESREKEKAKVQQKQDIEGVLGGLTKTLQGGNLGYTVAKFGTEKGRRDKQYFDTLAVQLESIAKDMISKGVLARDRFAYLLGNLPSSGKSDASNAGAIEAWADELKVDRPEGLEALYGEEKKVDAGTPLDEAAMTKIYDLAKGDKQKAKKIARKMGYKVE